MRAKRKSKRDKIANNILSHIRQSAKQSNSDAYLCLAGRQTAIEELELHKLLCDISSAKINRQFHIPKDA